MVSEADLALALFGQLTGDPATRKETLKLIKKKFPQAAIPEIDAATPVENAVGQLAQELVKLRTELANRDQDAKVMGKFSALKAARGYTDEGVENIKKLMVEKSIADPDAAADHFDRINYKPAPIEPSGWQGSTLIDHNDEGVKSWLTDPDGMTDRIIGDVLTEARAGKLI